MSSWVIGYEGELREGSWISWGSAAISCQGSLSKQTEKLGTYFETMEVLNAVSQLKIAASELPDDVPIVWLHAPIAIAAGLLKHPVTVLQVHKDCPVQLTATQAVASNLSGSYTNYVYEALAHLNADRKALLAKLSQYPIQSTELDYACLTLGGRYNV